MKVQVNQEQIKQLLADKITIRKISKITKAPRSVISRIKNGKNVPYFVPKPRWTGQGKSEKNICTCCHCRPKMDGNEFLCRICYKEGPSEEDIWSVNISHILTFDGL